MDVTQIKGSKKTSYKIARTGMRATVIMVSSVLFAACGGGSNGGNNGNPVKTVNLNTFQRANLVIGQADFVGSEENQNGTPEANTLNRPGDSVLTDGMFFVVDSTNNRVLGFNALPGINNMNADLSLIHI